MFIWKQKTNTEQQEALGRAGDPFNHDPRGDAERKRYEDAQRKSAERLRDRKHWERYRDTLGKENVPSFSGFGRMKAAGSESWQEIKRQFSLINSSKAGIIKKQGETRFALSDRKPKKHPMTQEQIDNSNCTLSQKTLEDKQ